MDYKRIVNEIESVIASSRNEKPLTLGEIIDHLEVAIREAKRGANEYVSFDWGSAHPVGFCSYRGDYDDVALTFSGLHADEIRAGSFLKLCNDSLGSIVHGWKGGDYRIDRDDAVYVACNGCVSDTRVVGVRPGRYAGIEILTRQIPEVW